MTLAICSHVSNIAVVPLVAMLIKLMYEAVLMANIPTVFIICKSYILLIGQIDIKDNKFTYRFV